MIRLHHLEHSRSQRILWLLEELGLDYEVVSYERDPETRLAPASLEAVHPLGKSPVITDDGETIAESGAIIEYLVDTYDDGSLKPADGTPEARRYTYWLHYAEGSFMPLMIVSLILRRIESAPMPFFAKPVARQIAAKVRDSYLSRNVNKHLAWLETSLGESTWFCGEAFTAADVQMSFALEAAEARADMREEYPRIAAFLERSRARPAYRRAIERGGAFDLGALGG